jgi:hypothetical protein
MAGEQGRNGDAQGRQTEEMMEVAIPVVAIPEECSWKEEVA